MKKKHIYLLLSKIIFHRKMKKILAKVGKCTSRFDDIQQTNKMAWIAQRCRAYSGSLIGSPRFSYFYGEKFKQSLHRLILSDLLHQMIIIVMKTYIVNSKNKSKMMLLSFSYHNIKNILFIFVYTYVIYIGLAENVRMRPQKTCHF